jgi:cytochrome c
MNVALTAVKQTGAFMNRLLIIAILVISTMPLYAQGQTPNTAKLKADAQNVVKIISGDKLKTQTYCEIAELSDQIDEEENPTKAEELSHKVNKLEEKLGPEYLALVGGLKDIDPNSQDAQEIGSILEALDRFCGD